MSATEAKVATLPGCDVHDKSHPAAYDASILLPGGRRTWAFVCEAAFQDMDGHLGMGRGQRLVVAT